MQYATLIDCKVLKSVAKFCKVLQRFQKFCKVFQKQKHVFDVVVDVFQTFTRCLQGVAKVSKVVQRFSKTKTCFDYHASGDPNRPTDFMDFLDFHNLSMSPKPV